MLSEQHQKLSDFIWSIANKLRGPYGQAHRSATGAALPRRGAMGLSKARMTQTASRVVRSRGSRGPAPGDGGCRGGPRLTSAVVVLLGLVLAACGGSSGSGTSAPTPPETNLLGRYELGGVTVSCPGDQVFRPEDFEGSWEFRQDRCFLWATFDQHSFDVDITQWSVLRVTSEPCKGLIANDETNEALMFWCEGMTVTIGNPTTYRTTEGCFMSLNWEKISD